MARLSIEGRRDSHDEVEEGKGIPTTSDSDSVRSSASFQNLNNPAFKQSQQPHAQQAARSQRKSNDHSAAPVTNDASQKSDDDETAAQRLPSNTQDTPHAAIPQQEPPATIAPEDQRTKLQTSLIVVALCSAVLLAALDVTITTVAIPTISADFQSTAGYTWIGSAYLLANAAAAPSWGKISDIFGRKPVLLTAVAIFWVGSLLCGVSVTMGMLIFGRAIQGIGGGGSVILVNICISDMFSVRKRGVYLGFVGLVWAVAGGFGPVLGGVFTTKATWRWCFYVNLPVAGLAFIVLYLTLKLHNPRTPFKQGLVAVDWLGSLTIVGGTLMFLLGLELAGGTYRWSSPQVICLLVFGVLVASMCIIVETRLAKFPLIPVRLFRDPKNLAVLGLCACHGFVFISVSYYLPLYFQGVLGASALMSGVYVLPFTFVLGAMSAIAGFVIKKTGRYMALIIGGFVLMTLGYGLFIDLEPTANWPKIILFQIVLALGVGPNFQSPLIALQNRVTGRDIASATGTYMFVRQIATSISVVVGGVIFDNAMSKQFDTLRAEVGLDIASLLTGNEAAASVEQVAALPEPQRSIAQGAYWKGLKTMFLFYVAFSALGLLISPFVGGSDLRKEHTEHKTGLNTLQPGRQPPAGDEEKGGDAVDGEGLNKAVVSGDASATDPEKTAAQT